MNKLKLKRLLKEVLPNVEFFGEIEFNRVVGIFEEYKVPKSKSLQKKIKKIFNDPESLYFFATSFFDERCEEFEEIIGSSSHYSYFYAVEVIQGKLPGDMHNRMIAYSLETEQNMSYWYFDYLKKYPEYNFEVRFE